MESAGSSFLLIILFVGFLFLLKKKKIVAMILISIFFLYVVPLMSFQKFKKKSEGTYVFEKRKIIVVDKEYKIIENEKIIAEGEIEYSNIDNYSFVLKGIETYETNIEHNITDGKNVFQKQ